MPSDTPAAAPSAAPPGPTPLGYVQPVSTGMIQLWLHPQQADLARALLSLCGACLSVVGCDDEAVARSLAQSNSSSQSDPARIAPDLRSLLVSAKPDAGPVVLLSNAALLTGQRAVADVELLTVARERGVPILTLEPIARTIEDLAFASRALAAPSAPVLLGPGDAQAPPEIDATMRAIAALAVPIGLARNAPGFADLPDLFAQLTPVVATPDGQGLLITAPAKDALDSHGSAPHTAFGSPTSPGSPDRLTAAPLEPISASIVFTSQASEGSLTARLLDALDLAHIIFGPCDGVTGLVRPASQPPEGAAALLRYARGRSCSISVAMDAGPTRRELTLTGPHGRIEIRSGSNSGSGSSSIEWTDRAGHPVGRPLISDAHLAGVANTSGDSPAKPARRKAAHPRGAAARATPTTTPPASPSAAPTAPPPAAAPASPLITQLAGQISRVLASGTGEALASAGRPDLAALLATAKAIALSGETAATESPAKLLAAVG